MGGQEYISFWERSCMSQARGRVEEWRQRRTGRTVPTAVRKDHKKIHYLFVIIVVRHCLGGKMMSAAPVPSDASNINRKLVSCRDLILHAGAQPYSNFNFQPS